MHIFNLYKLFNCVYQKSRVWNRNSLNFRAIRNFKINIQYNLITTITWQSEVLFELVLCLSDTVNV